MPIIAEHQLLSPLQTAAAFFRRLSVEEYHRLLEIGVLSEGEPVELLEGVMVNKWEEVAAKPPSLLDFRGFRKLTVTDYHKMIDAGVLKEGERVELLEGYLVNKMSHNTPHWVAIQKLTKRLVLIAPPGWEPCCQLPISLPDSEPEPDGVLARGNEETFANHHPLPAEIGLVVEVSDTSLQLDRQEKGRIYARVSIPVYWIINLVDRIVEVYSEPNPSKSPPAYETRTDFKPGDRLPIALDGKLIGTINVSDLLP